MALEHNTDVLSLGMFFRVFVVLDITALHRIDRVVSSHRAVIAWEPVRASLAEYNIAGDHILFCNLAVSTMSYPVHA